MCGEVCVELQQRFSWQKKSDQLGGDLRWTCTKPGRIKKWNSKLHKQFELLTSSIRPLLLFSPQARVPEEGECPIFCSPSLQPSSHPARRAAGREAQINTASPGMSALGAVSNLQHRGQTHSQGQQSSCWQEPFELGLAQSLETANKQSFCGLQQSGALFVEELGAGPRVVMRRELQESCTHTVGAGREEAVPGRGENMLFAATHKCWGVKLGEVRWST